MKKRRNFIFFGEKPRDLELLDGDCVIASFIEQFNDETLLLTDKSSLIHLMRQSVVDGIVVSSSDDLNRLNDYSYLSQIGRPFYIVSSENGQILATRSPYSSQILAQMIKRLFDVLIALVGVLLTVFIGILIYPFVQKQAPGPLIFKQERVGYNGRRFTMYKFRSMYVGSDNQKEKLLEANELSGNYMFKMKRDPRVFPLGQQIRNWSVDELPQFINVLKGEMSFIGTRPPTVDEVQRYELHHFKRLACKPGITGMWQVSGRSNIQDFEEVVALDASYIDNWSLWLDVKIFLRTIKVVLKREGSK